MAGRPSRLFLGALAILAALLWRPADAGTAGEFDFYVLALSWSPSWCATNDRDGRSPQCNGRRPYTFIAHGLWPQNERSWPEDCPSTEPDRVPDALARSMADIIPSAGLAGHEWRKHGTCSGLTQPIYFRTLRAAFQKIKLPPVIFDGRIDRRLATDDIEKLMIRANPGLTAKGVAIGCASGQLDEIKICMDKSLRFRDCAEVDRTSCRSRMIFVPSIP